MKTSYRLREGSHPTDGLSLVMRDDGVGISGTISFWPLVIEARREVQPLLGPLAVHPERQNLGIGLALMREGLARAKALGHRLVLLVGDEPYYGRVGFRKLPRDLLLMPGPTNPDRFIWSLCPARSRRDRTGASAASLCGNLSALRGTTWRRRREAGRPGLGASQRAEAPKPK